VIAKDKTIKVFARTIGGLAIIVFGFLLINNGSSDYKIGSGYLQSMLILAGFALIGYIFAWFRPKEGGYVLLFSGVIMGLAIFYHGGLNGFPIEMIITFLFIISGLLFLWYDKFLPVVNQESDLKE
jgi:hypothetical protein